MHVRLNFESKREQILTSALPLGPIKCLISTWSPIAGYLSHSFVLVTPDHNSQNSGLNLMPFQLLLETNRTLRT